MSRKSVPEPSYSLLNFTCNGRSSGSVILNSSASADVAAMRSGVSRLPRFTDFILEAIHAFLARVPACVGFAPWPLQVALTRCYLSQDKSSRAYPMSHHCGTLRRLLIPSTPSPRNSRTRVFLGRGSSRHGAGRRERYSPEYLRGSRAAKAAAFIVTAKCLPTRARLLVTVIW